MKKRSSGNNENRSYAHVETNDTVRDVVNHPAFQGFEY